MAGYRIPSDYKNDVSKYTHGWRSPAFFTMHPGLAYVTHHRHLNTGDRVRGNISQLVQSQPMVGPLMQGFRMITIATFTPDSIIYGWMRNGIRYTPSQWSQFDKWYLHPVMSGSYPPVNDQNMVACVDPSGSDNVNIQAFLLCPGMMYSNTPDSGVSSIMVNYNYWKTPYFVDDVDADANTLGFHTNYFGVVGRGGLFDCLGVAPGAVVPAITVSGGSTLSDVATSSFNFSVAPFVAYFLSTYYYLANMQEPYMYYSRGVYSLTAGSPFNVSRIVNNLSLANLGFHDALCGFDPDVFLKFISVLGAVTQSGNYANMNILTPFNDSLITRAEQAVFQVWLLMGLQAHGGLFSVPYRPDFFNNIIKIGDSPTVSIPVISDDDSNYSVAIPDLRYYNKIQNAMDRIFVAGGRFGDQLRTLFGTNSDPYTNKPDFLGIWQASVNPTNTVAMAAGSADGESSVPGQLTARLDYSTDFGGRRIDYYAKEPGTVMFITFIVPMPAYSQGLHPDLAVTTFADEFNPELKGLGFQSVPRCRYSLLPQTFANSGVWSTGVSGVPDPNMTSVGDTVAWDWLKTDYPRLHGEFATNGYFSYWTLERRFTDVWVDNLPQVGEYFGTYVNPLAWQYIFVSQSLLDPNFFVGMNFDLKVTSSVPANYMPYLGR